MEPILPIVSILTYWAIILGFFGGLRLRSCCDLGLLGLTGGPSSGRLGFIRVQQCLLESKSVCWLLFGRLIGLRGRAHDVGASHLHGYLVDLRQVYRCYDVKPARQAEFRVTQRHMSSQGSESETVRPLSAEALLAAIL